MNINNEITNESSTVDLQQGQEVDNKVNPGAIRKSTTQSILKAASQAAGMEFDSVEAMASALARLSAQTTQSSQSNTQPMQQETINKRLTTTDLHDQFQSLRQDLAKKEQALREKELDGEIRGAMGDRFDTDLVDYALQKVKSNIVWEDGAYAIVNSKGQIRYGEDGNPLTIQGLVSEVAKTNPKLLKMAGGNNTGSGLRPREGMFGGGEEVMPDYNTDPAGFNAWATRNGLGKGVGLKGVKASVTNSSQVKRVV
jgi:hypothetical protein